MIAGWLAVLVATEARAQTGGSGSRAAAEALFNDGRKLAASGKYAEACPKFEASQRLDPGLGTLLNLAECYEKLGKTASAWAEYKEAIPLARASGSKTRQDLATERAQALESRLSMLTIRAMSNGDDSAHLEIRRDGVPVQDAELGSPIPVDPGPHTVEASAPGKQKWSSTVKLADSDKVAVDVPLLTPLPTGAPPASEGPRRAEPAATSEVASESSGSTQRTAALIVGAVGVAGLGIGTVFGLGASSKWSDAKSKCGAYPYECSQEALDAKSSASSKAAVATVALVVGGAAIAGAAVLWFTASPSKETNVALGVAPGALFVRGSY